MTELLKKALDTTIQVSEKTELAVPFTKKYFKSTPYFWRVVGDSLMSLGTLGAILGIKNPVFAIVCAVAGWVGKVITNCAKAVD